MKPAKGFTLIELLIVVAIIAILAAIAVPNFLEAQVRSKTSRVMSDMRTIAVALESYAVDNNRVPIGYNEGQDLGLWPTDARHYAYFRMTSPVAYLSSIPMDPFTRGQGAGLILYLQDYYQYQTHMHYTSGNELTTLRAGFLWRLRSVGPNGVAAQPYFVQMVGNKDPSNIYDPTNGTKSFGDIHLTNKGFFDGSQIPR